MSTDRPAEPESLLDLGYADALSELEGILADLERDDVDVDVLGPKVRRAAELIRVCRAHIGAAQVDIEQIMVELDDAPAGGSTGASSASGAPGDPN